MNVLYIHTHDTGRYIQPYGYAVPTPELMKLAKEGTLFRNCCCAGPTCSPSRAALLTGMAPHSCGMLGLSHRGFQLKDYNKHIVNYLKKFGYETALSGIQHVARKPEVIGYDRILHKENNTSRSGDRKDFILWDLQNAINAARYIKEERDKPFFLSFGMLNTHRRFPEISEDINPDYVMPPLPLADNDENRKDMAAFISSLKTVDKCIGIVLDALRDSGRNKDTIVIFTTDHGIAFPKMKCNLYDTGIGVSLIIKYPGNKKQGVALDSLVSHIDIFPTICDLLNIEKPSWLQGYSMMPLFNGEQDSIREELFSEVTFHAAYEPMRCIRTKRYKLIKFFDDHDKMVPSNIDDSPSKEFLAQNGLLDIKREKLMLFDLFNDPVERINLADDAGYKSILDDLLIRLEKWMRETDDPLLNGKVEKPDGAIVNKLSCYSPTSEDYE